MKFKLEIQCDGSAFFSEPTFEIVRLLQNVKERVLHLPLGEGKFGTGALIDYNGNEVGRWVYGESSVPFDKISFLGEFETKEDTK